MSRADQTSLQLQLFFSACRTGERDLIRCLSADFSPACLQQGLALACEHGHLPVVIYLVGAGADPLYDRALPIRLAVMYGHLPVVQYLLPLSGDPGPLLDRLLEVVCEFGQHLELIRYLVGAGADPRRMGERAFRQACATEHAPLLEYLLERGVSPESVAVELAAMEDPECQELLQAYLRSR